MATNLLKGWTGWIDHQLRGILSSPWIWSPKNLVGGWDAHLKHMYVTLDHCPRYGVNMKKRWNHHLEIQIRKSATKISFPDLKLQFTCFLPLWLPEFCDGFALPCDGECSMLQNYANWIGTLPSNSGKRKFRLGSLKMCKSWWYCDEAGRDPILLIKCTRQSSDHSALENQSIWTYWLINHKQTIKQTNKQTNKQTHKTKQNQTSNMSKQHFETL